MAIEYEKTIHEYQYCAKTERRQNFGAYGWRNYKFYSLIDNPSIFETQDTLYSFRDTTKECATLRRNDYLLKVANAMAFFGEKHIIRSLNEFCIQNINEPAIGSEPAYTVPPFQQWTEVTGYVGNYDNPSIPAWKRQKKQHVYDQIRIIAGQQGIPGQHWNTLTSLYLERNRACHQKTNIADAESMREYANGLDNQMERDGVTILSDLVIQTLPTTRRARR